MDDDDEIPAASIGHVDLAIVAQRFPEAAREIARLNELMQAGAESPEEFLRLCELLHEVGETREAEYLLRRNMNGDDGHALYTRLFGTATTDNFQRAVHRFAEQFGVDLTLYQEWDFLDHEYESRPHSGDHSRHNILNGPCLVRISFTHRDFVTANVVADDRAATRGFKLDTYLTLRWQDDQWQP